MSVENGTTILFGPPGVAVDCVEDDGEGVRMVHLRTDDGTAAACRERLCPRTAFTESIAELPPYAASPAGPGGAAGASIGAGRRRRRTR